MRMQMSLLSGSDIKTAFNLPDPLMQSQCDVCMCETSAANSEENEWAPCAQYQTLKPPLPNPEYFQ